MAYQHMPNRKLPNRDPRAFLTLYEEPFKEIFLFSGLYSVCALPKLPGTTLGLGGSIYQKKEKTSVVSC